MSAVSPSEHQITELLKRIDDGPVVMINLLKFRSRAIEEECSGAVAYGRYADAVSEMIEDIGGRTIWIGRADQILIGDSEQDWDLAWLVEYPTRRAFLDMVSQPEYQAIQEHRDSGLERASLVACSPILDGVDWSKL